MTVSQKCGVFLCRFQDTVGAPEKPVSFFRKMFLKRGSQSLNDYWADVSLNAIDLEGTEIHDWKTLPMTTEEFKTRYSSRYDKIHGAAGFFNVDLSQYVMIIVITNGNVGDAGSHGGVLVNEDIINHTFIAHEMGHNFGLGHSFDTSARRSADWSGPGEYFDKYDVMSAMNVHSTAHAEYGSYGPRLCAHFLNLKGWMPDNRKWTLPQTRRSFCQTINLVALGHREQLGYLMVDAGDYTIEFRTKDDWDSGIPRPAILIHQINEGNPYLIASDLLNDVQDWQVGQTWNSNPSFPLFGNNISVHIESFDLENYTAKIRICYSVGFRRLGDDFVTGGQLIGQSEIDGTGYIIINGKIIKIPPRSPFIDIVNITAELKKVTEDSFDIKAQIQKISELKSLLNGLGVKK